MNWWKQLCLAVQVGHQVYRFLREVAVKGKARLSPQRAKADRLATEDAIHDFLTTKANTGYWAWTDLDNDFAIYAENYLKSRHLTELAGRKSREQRIKECMGEAFMHIAFIKTWNDQDKPPIDRVHEIDVRLKALGDIVRDSIRIVDGNVE